MNLRLNLRAVARFSWRYALGPILGLWSGRPLIEMPMTFAFTLHVKLLVILLFTRSKLALYLIQDSIAHVLLLLIRLIHELLLSFCRLAKLFMLMVCESYGDDLIELLHIVLLEGSRPRYGNCISCQTLNNLRGELCNIAWLRCGKYPIDFLRMNRLRRTSLPCCADTP